MVHLPRRILDLSAVRSRSRDIKIATKKASDAKRTPRSHDAEGRRRRVHLRRKGLRYTRQVGCLLNLPLKGVKLIPRDIFLLFMIISLKNCQWKEYRPISTYFRNGPAKYHCRKSVILNNQLFMGILRNLEVIYTNSNKTGNFWSAIAVINVSYSFEQSSKNSAEVDSNCVR